MQTFNNVTTIVRDDLAKTITKGSRLSMAAACFSIYAFDALKKQLEGIEELRFLFTSPTFLKEKAEKAKREFYIPRLNRERNLYGTEFELHLRNKFQQRAVARECAAWIREKVRFKSEQQGSEGSGYLLVEPPEGQAAVYLPLQGFTTSDLGCERGAVRNRLVNKLDAPAAAEYLRLFDSLWDDREGRLQDVTDIIIEHIGSAYNENAPEFLYFVTLYNIFHDFLENVTEDELPNEATGFKQSKIWNLLYDFQKDAALAIINKLEHYNGCILADSVGLGKTFTALAVIKYYQQRNKSILVLCPKKLAENWNTYRDNYKNNPVAADRLNYTVLFHTDLSRDHGTSNGVDLARLNWQNYDLVVIDESHNFRNGDSNVHGGRENRYLRLLHNVVQGGVKTKVLMLSATPVNNRFRDLEYQLALAYEGDPAKLDEKLPTKTSIREIFAQAQRAYGAWCKRPPEARTTEALLRGLSFDFFRLLDSVTIARSRRHIQKYYDMSGIGSFPARRKPITERPPITRLPGHITYQEIYDQIMSLSLAVYTPSHFIQPSRRGAYAAKAELLGKNITMQGREEGIRRLMSINLMKRLESSIAAFRLTLTRVRQTVAAALAEIGRFEAHQSGDASVSETIEARDFDGDELEDDLFSVGRTLKISLRDMDYLSWQTRLSEDAAILDDLIGKIADITPAADAKLAELKRLLREKIHHPINPGNRKAIIFTAFADTAAYLYKELAPQLMEKEHLAAALITGTGAVKTTARGVTADFNEILTCFSPLSKDRAALWDGSRAGGAPDIDLLIATDCISEGQNLQDCDYLVNYDIHWNPVRIIQRFGRIDRIGSRNAAIQLVNFWPDMGLDEYIGLKERVEARMRISVLTATGDDDPINAGEHGDLAYRSSQLKKLQEQVLDLEDMSDGISITDLGLNEYRLDIMEYLKTHDLSDKPLGMHAVAAAEEDLPPGIIFVLRNVSDTINEDHQNQLHPYYLVYIGEDGGVVSDYLQPKKILDAMRRLCRGKTQPDKVLCAAFNRETKDGADMRHASELLSSAINAIMDTKEESDIDSLFRAGGTSALLAEVKGIDDFELVTFLVIQRREADG